MRSHDSRSVLCFAVHRGFKLLAAMGYKQGQKIGKSGSGLAEPLPLLLKQARAEECVRVGRQTHCLIGEQAPPSVLPTACCTAGKLSKCCRSAPMCRTRWAWVHRARRQRLGRLLASGSWKRSSGPRRQQRRQRWRGRGSGRTSSSEQRQRRRHVGQRGSSGRPSRWVLRGARAAAFLCTLMLVQQRAAPTCLGWWEGHRVRQMLHACTAAAATAAGAVLTPTLLSNSLTQCLPPARLQVCETLDAAAGIHSNILWAQPPAAAAGAASAAALAAAAAADDLLEQCEPCHKAEAAAAIRAAREEAADCSRLFGAHAEAAAAAGSRGGSTAAAKSEGQPGSSEDTPAAEGDKEEQQRLQEWEAFHSLPAAERLARVLAYLRDRHCYCLFCGCHYEDAPDMQQHCPGPSEDDHE